MAVKFSMDGSCLYEISCSIPHLFRALNIYNNQHWFNMLSLPIAGLGYLTRKHFAILRRSDHYSVQNFPVDIIFIHCSLWKSILLLVFNEIYDKRRQTSKRNEWYWIVKEMGRGIGREECHAGNEDPLCLSLSLLNPNPYRYRRLSKPRSQGWADIHTNDFTGGQWYSGEQTWGWSVVVSDYAEDCSIFK